MSVRRARTSGELGRRAGGDDGMAISLLAHRLAIAVDVRARALAIPDAAETAMLADLATAWTRASRASRPDEDRGRPNGSGVSRDRRDWLLLGGEPLP